MRAVLALLTVGCAPIAPTPAGEPPTLSTPRIVEASLTCDADDAAWTLEVLADAWTGGGVSVWTVDGVYVEVHKVLSVVAAADGSADELLLELGIVEDWREAASGATTNFSCPTDPNVVFVLDDVHGDPVDCRAWGPDPSVWEQVADISACE